jgi:hypothetical protein
LMTIQQMRLVDAKKCTNAIYFRVEIIVTELPYRIAANINI